MVSEVAKTAWGCERVVFVAINSDETNSEDNLFISATAAASLKLDIDKPAAQGKIKPGQKYYIELTLAPS